MENEKIDILNRESFVGVICKIIDTYQQNKQNGSFAVYGAWGTGKSFVLDKVKDELEKDNDKGKYIVIDYNVWAYDYYDEPLIALLVAIMDDLAKNGWLDKPEKFIKEKIKPVIFSLTKMALLFNPTYKILSDVTKGVSDEIGKIGQEWKNYDKHIGADDKYFLKETLKEYQHIIKELAGKRTIVFLVDELDRCIPKYQIKVLERMHHLLNEIDGQDGICIYAINKDQLKHTVKSIFGDTVDFNGYMKKFIDYNIELGNAPVNDKVMERHNDILSLFQQTEMKTDTMAINKLIKEMLSGLSIRTQEKIWEKQKLLHTIAFKNDLKKPILVLGMEIMILAMLERQGHYELPRNRIGVNLGQIPFDRIIGDFFNMHISKEVHEVEDGLGKLFDDYKNTLLRHSRVRLDQYNSNKIVSYLIDYKELTELQVMYLWFSIQNVEKIEWIDLPEPIQELVEPLTRFYNMAEMMQDREVNG